VSCQLSVPAAASPPPSREKFSVTGGWVGLTDGDGAGDMERENYIALAGK